MGVGRHLPPDAGRGLLRRTRAGPGRGRSPTRSSAAPGRQRRTCINCGSCMTGCRHNAKNTLVKNYLHLAEQAGAVVHPLTTVTRVRPRDGGGYEVDGPVDEGQAVAHGRPPRRSPPTRSSSPRPRSAPRSCSTRSRPRVTCPASATGSGVLTRTNSEAILWRQRQRRRPPTTREGVAITSSFHPDEHTHIEPVRYGARFQRDGADADRRSPTSARTRTAVAHLAGQELWTPARTACDLYDSLHWSRAHRDRAGHADPRQLDHHGVAKKAPLRVAAVLAAGPRRAQPDLHPCAYDAARRMARIMGGHGLAAPSASPSTCR